MPFLNDIAPGMVIVLLIVTSYYLGVIIRHYTSTREQGAPSLRIKCVSGILPCLLVIAAMGGIVHCIVRGPFDVSKLWPCAFLVFLIAEQGTLLNDHATRIVQTRIVQNWSG